MADEWLTVPGSTGCAGVKVFMGSSTGLPAITFQAGFSPATATAPAGVPIGIELLGRPFTEPTLIKLAYSYEQATHHRKPPLSTPALPGESFSY